MKLIKQAFRTLSKFKLYFTINSLGLVLSLTCGMILLRYIHQELTVDHYIKELDRVYLTVREYQNQPPQLSSISNPNNDPNYVNIVDASIESHSTFVLLSNIKFSVNELHYGLNVVAADTMFLDILSYRAKVGDIKLRGPKDAIITDQLAKQLFGNEDPLGRNIVYDATGDILTITGVIEEPATKTSINFDILLSADFTKWSRTDVSLIKLFPNVDVKEHNRKYDKFVSLTQYSNLPSRLQLFPLKDLYTDHTIFVAPYKNGIIQQGNSKNIIVLSSVLVLLLVIGFFNYSNIYTVLTLNRAREFGVKKVFGANGKYVFGQIWIENLLLTLVAMLVVWMVIELTGGLMESLFSIPIKSNPLFDVCISCFVLFVFPILVSLHPTIKYNYAPPIVSLRSVNIAGKSVVSRIVFLSLQYIITFFILVLSLFFMKQLNYMLNMDLGYRTSGILSFNVISEESMENMRTLGREEFDRKREWAESMAKVFQQKMEGSPLIERWTQGEFLHTLSPYMAIKKEGGEFQNVAYGRLTGDYMDLFGFQLLEGRLWDSGQDEWAQYKMIINETTQKLFNIKDITSETLQPERRLWWSYGMEGMDKNPAYEIVGVIKDFKSNHLSKENVPIIIVYENGPSPDDPVIVAFDQKKEKEVIKFLKDTYNELIGDGNFTYTLLEDEIAALYKEDKRVSIIYITFAIVAILISCLGLFGLSLFDIRQRYREIALRKINGASVKDIVSLLLKKYTYILGLSFLLAVPLSYFVIIKYLEGFAHKAPVSWWLFAAAGILVGAISYLTLYFQIKKAVKINPAIVLKSE